jgi:uncharacterized protein
VPVSPPLSVFPYANVQLLDGPFRTQFEQNHKVFLELDEDGLLKPFRKRQGMPAPGPNLGGWYDDADDFDSKNNFHAFIPGHSFGQYLSGLARAYAITGSKPTQTKVHRLVRAFAETVEPTGNQFYVDYRLPGYTFDKTCCGLIDAHEFAVDAVALDVLKRATDAVLPHLPEKALSRAEQEARPTKRLRTRGMKPIRCQKTSSSPISVAGTSAILSLESVSSITSITTLSPKIRMPCR